MNKKPKQTNPNQHTKRVKLRFYPNDDLKDYLAQVFGHNQYVYNTILFKRNKRYEEKMW